MGHLETEELFGTALKGDVADLNAEPENRRAGLVWMWGGDWFSIAEESHPDPNLANHRGIVEEIKHHLTSGGINLTFVLPSGTHYYEIRPNKFTYKKLA